MTTIQSLPTTLRLGPVHLNVTDLARSAAFYERSLGLHVRSRGGGVVELGDSTATSLALHAVPGARPGRSEDHLDDQQRPHRGP